MGAQTFLAFSCPHFPLEDKAAIDWLLSTISDEQPDVIVHLGDGHEADGASKWPSCYSWSLEDEYVAHNKFLRAIRGVSPGSRKVFLPGNHEENISRTGRPTAHPKVRSLLGYQRHEPELMEHWEQPAIYEFSKRGAFRLGQVTFLHGFQAGAAADEMVSYILGLPYGLTIQGHTHKPKAVTRGRRTSIVPLPYWHANPGCMRDLDDVEYMNRNFRQLWGHGLVIGEAEGWRYDTTLIPRKRLWTAETRFLRVFEDG